MLLVWILVYVIITSAQIKPSGQGSYGSTELASALLLPEQAKSPKSVLDQFASLTIENKGAVARDHVCISPLFDALGANNAWGESNAVARFITRHAQLLTADGE